MPGYGTLTIAGDYEGRGELHLNIGALGSSSVAADKLAITGAATGNTLVYFHQDTPQPALPTGYSLPGDVITFAGAVPKAFVHEGDAVIFGGTEYIWRQTADGGMWRTSTVAEVDAATGADAAALLAGKAAAGALGDRLAALRLNQDKTGVTFWADAFHRHDKLRDSIYKDSRADLYGMQLGADYRIGSDVRSLGTKIPSLTVGVFFDYSQSDLDQTSGRAAARAENHATGLYAMLQDGAWHIEILARASEETYRVTFPGQSEFRIKGASSLQQISAGWTIRETRDWHIEPQISITRQRVNLDTVTSPIGITYAFDDAESLEARAAVRLWEDYERKNGLVIRPSLRVAALYDFKGTSAFAANGERFATSLGGAACQVDAAVAMQLTRRLELNAAVAYLFGSKLESYNATLGLAWRW